MEKENTCQSSSVREHTVRRSRPAWRSGSKSASCGCADVDFPSCAIDDQDSDRLSISDMHVKAYGVGLRTLLAPSLARVPEGDWERGWDRRCGPPNGEPLLAAPNRCLLRTTP